MSKIALKGGDTGTAKFTLEAPSTNTNRVLTLPDLNATILAGDSSNVGYDNTTSGLSATDLQGVVDELVPTGGVVAANKIANLDASKITSGNLAAARITDALNAGGSAPIYVCRAWVNFNGTGTVAIRASGNVSSITDNGTGSYTVNFTTAMEDVNYCAIGVKGAPSPSVATGIYVNINSTSAATIVVYRSDYSANNDVGIVSVAIFR